MAELTPGALQGSSGSTLARGQLGAVAWLRWRIYANGFRRKGGAAELVGRILLIPLVAALTVGPAIGAGFAAWYFADGGSFGWLSYLFWAAFVLSQLFNLNLGQPGTTFDPTELIRFPMALRHYVLVRLGFGLLSPGNIVVSLMSATIFLGVVVALPRVWPQALLTCVLFALTNVLFSRMIFAWIDRWLSTRRAREIFTGLIFAGSLLFQYVNLNYNPGLQHGHKRAITSQHLHTARQVLTTLHPFLRWLPPELAGSSIVAGVAHQTARSVLLASLLSIYALVCLLVYSLRMRTEYRGENLSDAANAVHPSRTAETATRHPVPAPALFTQSAMPFRGWLPPTLLPLLTKELLLLRRNVGLLYGVVAPTVMVFLFAGRLSLRGGAHWLLLLAVAYALLGLAPMSYNSFGLEGTGTQFYFLSPVPLREVFLAKNTIQFLLASFDIVSILAIVAYVAGRPRLSDVVFVLLWSAMALLFNASVGNLRTISAPKKVQPGRAINRTQSQVSAWIAIGILVASAAVGGALQLAAWYLHKPWISLLCILILAAVAGTVYLRGLAGIERYAMDRRESLFEELGKKV